MAVYQTSGVYLPVWENNPGYLGADVINNITGGQGAKYLRILNSSSSNVATFSWTLDSQVYTYNDVSLTTTPPGTANATFNVSLVSNNAGSGLYQVAVNDPGTGYGSGNQMVIAGDQIGGTTPENDLNMYVGTVDESGGILTVTVDPASYPTWPPLDQAPTGVTNLLPRSESVVQVVPGSTTSTGIAISTTGAGTDIIYVEAVTVIG